MKKKKVILIILIGIFVIGVLTILGFRIYKSFGETALFPIFALKEGNSSKYSVDNVDEVDNSPVGGKFVLYIGSSVTKGYGSCGTTFVDYLHKKYNIAGYVEAVNGTTIATIDEKSYYPRMSGNSHSSIHYDAVVCQLSTNDAKKNIPIDKVKEGIESIIYESNSVWDCPVIFFTNPRYDSEQYGKMVEALYEVQKEYDIIIIDLWNDEEFNNITEEERKLYMLDDVHPTKAGYLEWWLPKFEEVIIEALAE